MITKAELATKIRSWVRRCEANGMMPYCLKRSEVTALMKLADATDFIESDERWLPEDYRDS